MLILQSLISALRRPQLLRTNLTYRRKQFIIQALRRQHDNAFLTEKDLELDEEETMEYHEIVDAYLGSADAQRVCVLQPYIKWGKHKKRNTTPALQLAEAVALVDTLRGWKVVDQRLVPLLTLQQKKLLGSGALENLKDDLRNIGTATAVFVSTNRLKFHQIQELQEELHLPVYDRYSLIIHIFRQHATTTEAKLQVALAELPYIKRKLYELTDHRGGRINLAERRKLIIEKREKKLKAAMRKLEQHRDVIRVQRRKFEYPSVAIVGYTNAGKTSLIKTLTGEKELTPRNQLFATLDTTVHEGVLPSSMKVLFVDTIGFIQDVPETLIEPFNVTLQDAINADVLVHIFDASHPDMEAQVEHVRNTLDRMVMDKTIIEVANKCDLLKENQIPEDALQVSATQRTGIARLLERVEEEVMTATGKQYTRIKVRSGSSEASWLYKQTTVVNVEADPGNPDFLIMKVISSPAVISKFKHMMRK